MGQGIFSKGLSSMQSLCPVMCIVLCLFIWKPSLWRGLLNNSQVLITSRIIRRSHLDLGKLQDRRKTEFKEVLGQLFSTESDIVSLPLPPPPPPTASTLQGHWAISENICYFHDWGSGATGIQKVVAMTADSANKLQCAGQPPPQRVIQSVLSMVLNLRIPALGSYLWWASN